MSTSERPSIRSYYIQEDPVLIPSGYTADDVVGNDGDSMATSYGDPSPIVVYHDPSVPEMPASTSPQIQDPGQSQGQRDWAAEFTQIMAMSSKTFEAIILKNQRLAELFRDFADAATSYGRIIISEIHLPDSEKSLLPTKLGGIAGGEKFIFSNILFKFAFDLPLPQASPDAPPTYMYGGSQGPFHRMAIKASGAELRNLSHLSAELIQSKAELVFPLMTLIDFAGFRLIALSVMPVDHSTLAFGSADGGASFTSSCPAMAAKIDLVCSKLRLKPHRALGTSIDILPPCDLEGHVGYDGSHILLDFGRLFPPEALRSAPPPELGKQVFYRFLRPEFLLSYSAPLCADAFSGWLTGDPLSQEHNAEVAVATKYLHATCIPKLAEHLDTFTEPPAGVELIDTLHAHGVNIRHLGGLFRSCQKAASRTVLLNEAVARCLKNLFNARLRSLRILSVNQRHRELLQFSNQVLHPAANPASSPWATEVPPELRLFFHFDPNAIDIPGITPPHAMLYGSPLFYQVQFGAVFLRLAALINLTLSERFLSLFASATQLHQKYRDRSLPYRSPDIMPKMIVSDIVAWDPSLKQLSFASHAEAKALYLSVASSDVSPTEASASLKQGLQLAKAASHSLPSSLSIHLLRGLILFEQGKRPDISIADSRQRAAETNSKLCQAAAILQDIVPSALPAQSSSEPSLMKPLVALLCNSMDGFVSAEICYFLGEIYLNLKSWKKAAAALTSALQMDTSGKIANWIFSEFNRLFFEDMVYKGASNAYDALGTILLKLKLLRDLEPYSTQSLILDVVLRLQRVGYSCQLAELVPIGTDLEIYQRASEALLSYMALTDTPVEEVMATLTNSSKFALFTLKTAHLIRLCAANPSLSAKMLPLIQESFIAPPFQLTLLHHSTFSHHDRDVAAIYFLEHWEPPTPLILHLDATQLAFSEGVWKLLQKAALHVEELYVTSNQQQEHFSAFLKACTNLKVLSSTIELPLDALNCFPKLERLITATCYYVSTEFLATISSMQLRQLSISCDYDEIHPGFVATLARNPISILELNSRLTPSLLPTLLSGAPNLRTSLRRLLLTCTDTDPALEQVTQFQGLEILTLASYSSCLRMSGDISVLRSLPHLDSLVINACPLPSGADLRGGVACRSLEINGTNTACDDAAWKEMVVNSPSLRVFKSTVVFRTEFFSFITRSLPCLQELSIVTADLDHTNTPFELCAIPTLEKLSFVGEMCTDLSVWPTLFPNLRCLSLCRPRYTSPTADFSFFGKLLHLEDLSLDMRSISTTQVYQLTTSPPPLKRLSFTIPEITVDELEAQLIVDNFNLDYFRVERLTIRAREILVARIPTVESHFAFADSSLFPLSQAPSCIG